MNLLVTGAWQQAKDYIPKIEKTHKVIFLQQEKDELPCSPTWVEGVIGNGLFLYHSIELFTNLRFIQLTSAGYDRVPMDYVSAKCIKIYNARGVYSIPMAEYALSGVLALYKRHSFFRTNQIAHKWEKERKILELCGKKVCIFGCGSVGTECAVRFKAMGCTVFGVDPVVKEHSAFSNIYHINDIKNNLAMADIVIITMPLNEQTRYIFNEKMLRCLKEGAILVNIARGALIVTKALEAELSSKRISAILDVFEEEPLFECSKLWDMENVIITPHNSFVGEGNERRLSELILKNLVEVI